MSADNWRVCPQCLEKATRKRERAIAKAEDSYGKVSASEYRAAIAEASQPLEAVEHMREDYRVSVDTDGVFRLSYRAACEDCDFGFEKKIEEIAFRLKGTK